MYVNKKIYKEKHKLIVCNYMIKLLRGKNIRNGFFLIRNIRISCENIKTTKLTMIKTNINKISSIT